MRTEALCARQKSPSRWLALVGPLSSYVTAADTKGPPEPGENEGQDCAAFIGVHVIRDG